MTRKRKTCVHCNNVLETPMSKDLAICGGCKRFIKLITTEKCCANCKHYTGKYNQAIFQKRVFVRDSSCTRFPPTIQVLGDIYCEHPVVSDSSFCGEWRSALEDPPISNGKIIYESAAYSVRDKIPRGRK